MKAHKLNNRGASLIMVVIAFAFVMVLGSIIVRSVLINMEMKTVDRKSKYNFYTAEAALDEIRVGLVEDVSKALSEAYQSVMLQYSKKNPAMRKSLFHNRFIEEMKVSLAVSPVTGEISLLKLNSYLKETKKLNPTADGAQVQGTAILDTASSNKYITIKGLRVVCITEGYSTSITTDIRINFPEEQEEISSLAPYQDYALIADQALVAKFTDHTIQGNLYAGSKGIQTGNGKSLFISGSSIITKGDIIVRDRGSLIIQGSDTEVWASNLVTTQTNKAVDMSGDTIFKVTGKCYIMDDLALEAKRSKVTMEGEYYGYSDGMTSEANSAIIINAIHAKLDLSGLNKLYLAGRASISLDDGSGAVNYDTDDRYGAGTNSNCNIPTGESLVLKGCQNVYLLPSEYIAIGHNPVTWDEYVAYYDTITNTDTLVSIPHDAEVFHTSALSADECRLMYYLNELQPVKKAFYKFGSNDNVVYYYLNFKSKELATTYYKNYMLCYPERIYNGFPVEGIIINNTPGAYITAGNLMLYDSELKLIRGINATFTNHYRNEYQHLTATLTKHQKGIGDLTEDIVFENILDVDKIRADAMGSPGGIVLEKEALIGTDHYYVIIIDNEAGGTYHYDQSGKKGIIIATGDVSVERNFTGLIISNKTIDLSAAQITAASDLVSRILSQDADVARYFRAFTSTSDKGYINVSNLIHYENWKKN